MIELKQETVEYNKKVVEMAKALCDHAMSYKDKDNGLVVFLVLKSPSPVLEEGLENAIGFSLGHLKDIAYVLNTFLQKNPDLVVALSDDVDIMRAEIMKDESEGSVH